MEIGFIKFWFKEKQIMKYKTLAAAAVAALLAAPVGAAPIDLKLSFDGAEVTFFGLDNADTTSQKATGYSFIGTHSYQVQIGSFENSVNPNSFTFSDVGQLQTVDIFSDPTAESNDQLGMLFELSCKTTFCSAIEVNNEPPETFFWGGGITVGPLPTVTPVPLPAGGVLLMTALAGFAALKRRKKVAA